MALPFCNNAQVPLLRELASSFWGLFLGLGRWRGELNWNEFLDLGNRFEWLEMSLGQQVLSNLALRFVSSALNGFFAIRLNVLKNRDVIAWQDLPIELFHLLCGLGNDTASVLRINVNVGVPNRHMLLRIRDAFALCQEVQTDLW